MSKNKLKRKLHNRSSSKSDSLSIKWKKNLKFFLEMAVVLLGIVKLTGDRNYQETLNAILVEVNVRNTLAVESIHRTLKNWHNGTTDTETFNKNLQEIINSSFNSGKTLTEYIGDGKSECFWPEANIPDQNGNTVLKGVAMSMSIQAVDENGPLKNYLMQKQPAKTLNGDTCYFKATMPGFSPMMQYYIKLQTWIEWILLSIALLLIYVSRTIEP